MSDSDTTESKVAVEWVEKDVFLGADGVGHSIVFDSAFTGSPAKGFGPMRALLASLGACSGMDVAAILGKRRQKLTSLKIEISGARRRYGHPKPFTQIHLRYLIGGEKLEEKFVKEAVEDSVTKYCSVAATMNDRVKLTHSYEIVKA